MNRNFFKIILWFLILIFKQKKIDLNYFNDYFEKIKKNQHVKICWKEKKDKKKYLGWKI